MVGWSDTNHVRYVLEAIDQAVREIVRGVYSPFIAGAMMRACGHNSIRDQVPHIRIAIFEILLHAKDAITLFIRPVSHFLELR